MANRDIIQRWSAGFERAETFGDEGDFARRHLLNPAIFSLLGDARGKQILDAGCGQGYLSRLLARKGALVTGIEPAQSWIEEAMRREQEEPLGMTYLQRDLSSLRDLAPGFDAVVSNMVFMDIPDYQPAIRNCITALRRGGSFIFSLLHPCFDDPRAAWNGYVEVHTCLSEFTVEQRIGTMFHRPLSAYINLILEEDCSIRRLLEPRLDADLARKHGFERDAEVPRYLVVHAVKG
jgi:2-polyprenyl-3-methyl-5-hydroxy-6-metoxy-1,4-benzoquinol methylase